MILGIPGFNKACFLKAGLILILLSLFFQGQSFAQLNASFSLVNGTGCSPLNVQFSNNSTGAVNYFWDFGNGNTSVLQNPSQNYLVGGNYSVKLVAYSSGGQADSVIQTNIIHVVPQPVPSFTANITSGCDNNNLFLFSNNSTNFDSCLWDFGDGGTSTLLNPGHTYTTSGIYNVTLICYNTASGCSESFTRNQYITIATSPSVTVSVNVNSSCNLSQVFSFTTQATNATSFLWNFGDNTTSTLQNPSHTYATPGMYTVTLVAANGNGCTDTLVLPSYIDLKNNPVPSISISDSSGCAPLWASYQASGPISSILWTFGNGDSSTYTNLSHAYLISGTYTVSAFVTYTNGCSNSVSYNNMQVLSTPVSNISLSNFSGCKPLNVQCINNSSNGNTYSWDFGDGTFSSAFSPSHLYTNNGNFDIKLTVTNANGCSATSPSWTASISGAGADIFSDVTSGCPPLTVNFLGNPASQTAYYWDFGDGSTSALPNPQHTYNTLGSYNVTLAVTGSSGCTDTVSNPVIINVATPVNSFVPPDPIYGCAPMNINLLDNTPGASSWLWNFGDGFTGSGQSVEHTFAGPGTYVVSVITSGNGGGCEKTIPDFSTFIIGGGVLNFSYSQSICPPYTGYFQDSSSNAVSWLWDFGDGSTSTIQNPIHVYAEPGVYNVSLTVTTADGCTSTRIHNYALSFEPLIANATAYTNSVALPYNVDFFANSIGATSWFWTFGDGSSSSLENPSHTYTTPGPYTITLTISNDSCTFTYNYPPTNIGVGTAPIGPSLDSIHSPLPYAGCAPMPVNFHNPFSNSVSWSWDFGDGFTSTLSDPIHVYKIPGTYDVTLYALRSNGLTDSLLQPGSIQVIGGVDANFTFTNSNGCTGNTISLFPTAINIVNYIWNFGDSSVSSLANPVHTYPNNGSNYIISLYATDSIGCTDFMTQSFYASSDNTMQVSKEKVCSSDSVYFESGNSNYVGYTWHFGDGDSSLSQNVYHQYNDTGIYQVTLTVTDSTGCSEILLISDHIEVFDPEPSFTMQYYPNCVGVGVIFTNTSINADSWLWDFGDSTYSSTFNPMHVYTTPGYYTVTLTAFKNNCSNSITLPNGIFAPNTTINFTYTKDKDCLPVTITCVDSSTDVASWAWDFGDGSTSTLQNPQHTFFQVPANDVQLIITNVYGCKLKMSLPKIKPTQASFSLTDTTGCSPVTVSFNDSSSQVVSWHWNFGDGDTSSFPNPQHTYYQDGYYSIQLIVLSQGGCRDTIQADSSVFVSSVKAAFTSNYSAACAPVIIDFTDSSYNASTWNWDFGDGSSSQLKNPSHIYVMPGTYTVKLVTGNGQGCLDSLTIPDYIKVDGPVSGFIASVTSGCSPVSVQFTDTSLNAMTWHWSFGDGSSSTAINPLHIYNNPGQYLVSLVTEDSMGCQSAWSYPYNLNININPVASFTMSDTIGCSPLVVTFTNTSTGYDSLIWDFGDGHTLTNNSSASYTYTVPGTYYPYLTAYTNSGCADTFHLGQPVYVGLQPVADFSSNLKRGCAPLAIGFTNLSSCLANTTTYLWNFGNGDTSSLPDPTYTYNTPGIYTVTLTVNNGTFCTNTIVKTAYIQIFDINPPPPSPILRVSVLDDSRVEILWQNSSVPDLAAYELYKLNPLTNKFDLLYTDSNPNNSGIILVSKYTDTLLNTLHNTYTYKLRTIDLCENSFSLDSLDPHTTINISAKTQGNIIGLSWTPYLGCNINQYELYRSDPTSGSYLKIASVPATDSTYSDSTLICPELYVYRVTATDLCGNTYSSESDTAMAKPENPTGDQQVEVVRTTVVDDLNTLTEWKPPLMAPGDVVAYSILRSETENGNYTLIGNVGPGVFNFMDTQAEVHSQNYYYKVQVINKCNVKTLLSNVGSSILLLAKPENYKTRLVWTSYKGWDTGVSRYVIEKQNANGIWETIKIVDGNTLETEDK